MRIIARRFFRYHGWIRRDGKLGLYKVPSTVSDVGEVVGPDADPEVRPVVFPPADIAFVGERDLQIQHQGVRDIFNDIGPAV